MKKTGLKIAACLAVSVVAVAACGSSKSTSQGQNPTANGSNVSYPPIPPGPIKLGLSLALSGPSAAHGAFGQKGFQVALEQFNATHPNGIDGHQIVFDVQNDQGDSTIAAGIAKQFIDDKVVAVIEPSEDLASKDLQMQIWQKAGLPVVGYTNREGKYIDGKAWPYAFNIAAQPPAEIGQVAAKWLASHSQYKKIAILTDDTPAQKEWTDAIINPLKTLAPGDSVVTTASIATGSVDAATQVAKLKASNPDIVLVAVGVGLGPIWNAFHSANWAPPILALQNALYDGYASLGNLGATTVAPAYDCIPSDDISAIPSPVKTLMDAYLKSLGNVGVNMLVFANSDSMPLEALNYAITKYHSTSPDAIKAALEGLNNQGFIGDYFHLSFSPTNHFGNSGSSGTQMCKLSPLAGGSYSIPTYAP